MDSSWNQQLKLLVVDDEPDNLDLLYRTFRRDFRVFKAENGFAALELLEREGEMAIIISDQRMPRMNGTEFLSRTVECFPDTIRIVLTGYTDVEDLVEAINSGQVFKYITKPWNPDQLKNVVLQAAETYRVLKQRTLELSRALSRESLFNEVMRAIRESLDYNSMLQTIAETLGSTFEAYCSTLIPVDLEVLNTPYQAQTSTKRFVYTAANAEAGDDAVLTAIESLEQSLDLKTLSSSNPMQQQVVQLADERSLTSLVVPFIYQKDCLAIAYLHRIGQPHAWPEETINLINSVSEQVALAISQAMLYQRTQLQTEQMRAELAVARQIQTNLLRQSWPDIEGVRIQARCIPAREVGGDFFEVFVHPQGDIWLAVGDVSGKGVPAALFMASAISVLRRELSQESPPPPNVVMQNLNTSLSDDLVSNNCFITMVLVRYIPAQQKLIYANAGHVYPMAWSNGETAQADPEPVYLETRSVPIGILPKWQAAAGELVLASGSALVITSDGITEATISASSTNGSNAMLKQTGLWSMLKQQTGPLDLDQVLAQVAALNSVQEDDQTVLSLEVL
ncbi:SpoIIE family protein phosphatase [Almyronema epifaneia]|uniref:SpoIIE family protein phosphatase n=1 Tax=Almyronema epifaneia S1 TaxID=2991925 RepID=A0ABW6IBZ3_9CYAN